MGGRNEVEGNKKVIELSVIYRRRMDRETSTGHGLRGVREGEKAERGVAAGSGSLSKVLRHLWHVQFATSKVTSNVLLF